MFIHHIYPLFLRFRPFCAVFIFLASLRTHLRNRLPAINHQHLFKHLESCKSTFLPILRPGAGRVQRVSVWLPCGAYRYVRSEVTCRLDASPQPRQRTRQPSEPCRSRSRPSPSLTSIIWGDTTALTLGGPITGDVPSSSEESESESESESGDE